MANAATALDAEALERARALLTPRVRRESVWPSLAAAALLAVSGLAFAAAMLLAPANAASHRHITG